MGSLTVFDRLDNGRVSVHLSADDVECAEHIATQRNVNESHFGPRTWGKKDSYLAHLQGAMGEVAVARYYGVEPDLVFMDKGGGGATDNTINGYTVEVKTRPFYDPYYLMVAKHTFKGADVYIACCCEPPGNYVEIVGWVSGKQIKTMTPVRYKPHLPPSYVIPENLLKRLKGRGREVQPASRAGLVKALDHDDDVEYERVSDEEMTPEYYYRLFDKETF